LQWRGERGPSMERRWRRRRLSIVEWFVHAVEETTQTVKKERVRAAESANPWISD